MALKKFKTDDNKVVGVGGRAYETFKNLSKNLKNKKSKNLTYIKAIRESTFLTFSTKKVFNKLKQVLSKL